MLVDLGFFMCHIYWVEIEPGSDFYTLRKNVSEYPRLLVVSGPDLLRSSTRTCVEPRPEFLLCKSSDFMRSSRITRVFRRTCPHCVNVCPELGWHILSNNGWLVFSKNCLGCSFGHVVRLFFVDMPYSQSFKKN